MPMLDTEPYGGTGAGGLCLALLLAQAEQGGLHRRAVGRGVLGGVGLRGLAGFGGWDLVRGRRDRWGDQARRGLPGRRGG